MKFHKSMFTLLSLLFLFSVTIVAQEEMTEEEWQNEMNRLSQSKTLLTQELNDLQNEVNGLKAKKAGMQAYDDCIDELYAMVGATRTDVDNFRNSVNTLEGKINRKESPKNDRQAELGLLQRSRISALPEFFDKVHNQLQRKLDAWQEKPAEVLYTVVKGDCLWNIAKKKEHYGNGFAWPKIYNANRDKIKNPDLIYPKQVFKIPNLTQEEKAKYDKIRKNYKPAPPVQ